TKGLALDAELLDRVFKVPTTTVKCISHGYPLAFSQVLKTVLYKVVGQPDSVEVWVSMLDGFGLGSVGQGGGDFMEERTLGNINIKQCFRKRLNIPSMLSNTFSEPPVVAKIDCVFGCIKSFPKCTACGRDGLRAQHILDDLCGEGFATATDLLKAITLVINLWLAGRCPTILAKFVAFALLTPLLKQDNRIHPIAVGTLWRRLVTKVAMKCVGNTSTKSGIGHTKNV
ncbi:hypothetical protein Tco_1186740, partial [Tanacetum coccineum]